MRERSRRSFTLPFLLVLLLACSVVLQHPLQTQAWNGAVAEADINADNAFQYMDAWGHKHTAVLDTNVRERTLSLDSVHRKGHVFDYTGDPNYTIRRGVDVSHWTGSINWGKVKAGGYDFAFIRLGYMGKSGGRHVDSRAMDNIRNAQAAGLDVGVYYYSLAVNEKEAQADAAYVLRLLNGRKLQLPVMYDPEYMFGRTRNDHVSGAQFTKNAAAFCNAIRNAGYEAGVYANMIFECNLFDMSQIEPYHVWFADYEPLPQSPYYFEFLQYSSIGYVPGINTRHVDMNIQFVPTAAGLAYEQAKEQFRTQGTIVTDDGVLFDANYYANRYPDVAEWERTQNHGITNAKLLDHYLTTGRYENRFPNADTEAQAMAALESSQTNDAEAGTEDTEAADTETDTDTQ